MGLLGSIVDGLIEGLSETSTTTSNPPSYISNVPESQVHVQGEALQLRNASGSVPAVITTMAEMQTFLTELERNCVSTNITAKTAIQSQMLVINNIQSPTLVDTAFDTLILNLKKSLKAADEIEKEELREVYALMIQNYVFFMDAKYQAKVKANREESRALLEQAGMQLSRSVGQVACIATGIPSGGVEIQNLFDEDVEQTSLWSKVIKWWNKEADNAEAADNFIKSLYNIIKKLDKYHEVIGPSMLIAGIIDRYKTMLAEYAYSDAYSEAQSVIEENTPGANASIIFTHPVGTGIVFVMTSIVTLICWAFNGEWVKATKSWETEFPIKVAIVGIALTLLTELRCIIKASKERNACKAVIEEQTANIKNIQEEYNAMIQEFDRVQNLYEEII